jgi:hypothetical protein
MRMVSECALYNVSTSHESLFSVIPDQGTFVLWRTFVLWSAITSGITSALFSGPESRPESRQRSNLQLQALLGLVSGTVWFDSTGPVLVYVAHASIIFFFPSPFPVLVCHLTLFSRNANANALAGPERAFVRDSWYGPIRAGPCLPSGSRAPFPL